VLLISIYFSFTSLTTVGFGDFAPRADHERLIGAFMLLFGVLIFSYIMGKFIDMVNRVLIFNEPLEESESLTMFFSVIQHFNHNKPYNTEIKQKIEDYFVFKWAQDKNIGLKQK
jgi:hypothetical protein